MQCRLVVTDKEYLFFLDGLTLKRKAQQPFKASGNHSPHDTASYPRILESWFVNFAYTGFYLTEPLTFSKINVKFTL
jgi:hypothetical protein